MKIKSFAAVALSSIVLSVALAPSANAAQIDLTQCPLLVEGQSSECVLLLQSTLNQVDASYGLVEDGEFGPETRIAVLDFQARNGLVLQP